MAGESGPLTKNNCDYIYLGGFKHSTSVCRPPGDIPLMFDIPGNHKGFNVLFEDGQTKFIEADVGSCKGMIMLLHKKRKYDPAVLKKLMQKAEKLDHLYGLK